MVQTAPQTQGWQGVAHLVYQLRGDRCTLTQTFSRAPLKVQKPLYPEGEKICHSTLVHTAGGMVGGDSLDIALELGPDCRVLLTTAAANKIYGSQPTVHQGVPQNVNQSVRLTLAANSCLEWFPQETIAFNQARFHQDIRVELAPGAIWCGWDIMRFGRSARGERFDQGQVQSRLSVWQDQNPLWIDHQRLVGGSAALDSLNGLAGYPVVGIFALVGKTPDLERLKPLRDLWMSNSPGDVGVTRLQQGVLCRYRGPSSQAARKWFIAVWQELRPWYLNTSVTVPRVWGR